MRPRRSRVVLLAAAACLVVLAWSPWITEQVAIQAVVDHLGGPDVPYNYLGDVIPVGDVPKTVVRMPFCMFVYFPSEAMYIVTFWGAVL